MADEQRDIVARLRGQGCPQREEVADEIERLRNEKVRLERWLREQHNNHGRDAQELFERAEAAEARAATLEAGLREIKIAHHERRRRESRR